MKSDSSFSTVSERETGRMDEGKEMKYGDEKKIEETE
jgi:hypothetical protein